MTCVLILLCVILFALLVFCYIAKTKEIKNLNDEKTKTAWKLIRAENELNLLRNSIVVVEDSLPAKLSTPAIGMKLSNEMINYVEVDLEENKLKAKMIMPNYNIDDFAADYPERIEITKE